MRSVRIEMAALPLKPPIGVCLSGLLILQKVYRVSFAATDYIRMKFDGRVYLSFQPLCAFSQESSSPEETYRNTFSTQRSIKWK